MRAEAYGQPFVSEALFLSHPYTSYSHLRSETSTELSYIHDHKVDGLESYSTVPYSSLQFPTVLLLLQFPWAACGLPTNHSHLWTKEHDSTGNKLEKIVEFSYQSTRPIGIICQENLINTDTTRNHEYDFDYHVSIENISTFLLWFRINQTEFIAKSSAIFFKLSIIFCVIPWLTQNVESKREPDDGVFIFELITHKKLKQPNSHRIWKTIGWIIDGKRHCFLIKKRRPIEPQPVTIQITYCGQLYPLALPQTL